MRKPSPPPEIPGKTHFERLMNLGHAAFTAPHAPAKPKHRNPPKKRRPAR